MQNSIDNPVAVFRAASQRACDERAFVLTAVNIPNQIEADDDGFAVFVDQSLRAHAQHHLWHYEAERRKPAPAAAAPWTPHPYAWHGSVVYALVLLALPLAISRGWFALDLFARGVLDPARIQAGQWWRLWTALTLHWDASHLLGNLSAGALLGFCAAQFWGNARAWLLILAAAVLANFIETLLAVPHYISAGASTAVFAALGLLCSHAWYTRRRAFSDGNLRRWLPLVVGVSILALFGGGAAGSETPDSTNVLSHLLGFACGVAGGALASTTVGAKALQRLPSSLAVFITMGSMILSWVMAALA